jgi:hypothetical protein
MYLIIRSFFYPQKSNTKLIRILILISLFITFNIIFYGSFIEPQVIQTKRTNISFSKTSETENIKIVFLSDLHLGPYKQADFVEKIMQKVDAENPDLILFGGDYIYGFEENSHHLKPFIRWSEKYKDKMFAVTGNHEFNESKFNDPKFKDKTKIIREIFQKANIKILDNAHKQVTINGQRFYIAGIADLWTGQADADKAILDIDYSLPKILLSHNPDILLEKASENFDLILSGHTHGGQIRLPLIGSVPNIPDKLGRAYDKGLFKTKTGYLYISAGLGETGPRARLFNPPELTIINLDL